MVALVEKLSGGYRPVTLLPGHVREWARLRDSYGAEGKKKFESLRVWGQPSAWADSVMQCWLSDLLAEYVPQCITLCGCFQSQWTPLVLHASWFNQMFQIPVGPEVTPILQLADVGTISQAAAWGVEEGRPAVVPA